MNFNAGLHVMMRATAIAVCIFLFPVTANADAPAFDCAGASGQVEQLICSDENLAALDQELARVYQSAQSALPQSELPALKVEQRGWIKGRNDCWKAADTLDCVTETYQTRIVELQIRSGELIAPTAIAYNCGKDNAEPFYAAFYSGTVPASVVLTHGQDQVVAFIAPSGSGAKYVASGVEFWEHHGEALVYWFGTELKCSLLK